MGKVQNEVLRKPSSITYLALVFEREHDKRCWTVGIGLSAREQDASEEILCTFIAPDQSLRASDFTRSTPEGTYPLYHEDLLVNLRRVQGFENFGHRPTNFTKNVLTALRAKTGYSAEPKRFLTSIKNALRFKEMETVNQFVRDFLLDDDKIDIQALRSSVATWRGFQEKIEQLEEQKAKVDAAIAEYSELIAKMEEERRLRWVERKAECDRLDQHLASLRRELEAKRAELCELEAKLARTRSRKEATAEEIGDIRRSLETDNRELAIKSFRLDLTAAEKSLAEAKRHRDAYLVILSGSASILSRLLPVYGNEEFLRAKAACESLVSRMSADTKVSSRDVDAAVRGTVEPLTAYLALLDQGHDDILTQRGQLKSELNHNQDQLRNLMAGKALIRRETQSLIERLAAIDIEAVPISTLVEVIDEDWRDAVETVLGPAREALLVDPEDIHEATRFMRRGRRDFMGCQIANTTKSHEIPQIPKPDSLAAVVATDDRHVRSFLNRRLNAVIRVDTEEELLRVDRGATKDCLTAAAGTIEVRRPTERHLLGKDTSTRNRPLLEKRIAELEHQLDRSNREVTGYRGLVTAIGSYLDGVKLAGGLLALENAVNDATEHSFALQDNIRTLESERPVEIRERLESLECDLKGYKEDEATEEREVRVAYGAVDRLERDVAGAEDKAQAANVAFAAVDDLTGDERESYDRNFADLLGQFENLPAVRDAARDSATAAARRAQLLAGSAPRVAEVYGRDYDVPGWQQGFTHQEAFEWLIASRTVVENHHLTQYRDKVEAARLAMEESLRSDLLLKLYSRVEGAKIQIQALSRQLRMRVFHRERYELLSRPNPTFQDIVQVAKRIYENAAEVSTLFSADAELDGDIARGVAKIRAMLESGDDVSEISDYRNYLNFEMITRRIEDNEIASEYSKRQATGSGGEKQVPF